MTTRDSHIGSNTNTVCPIKSQLIQIINNTEHGEAMSIRLAAALAGVTVGWLWKCPPP